MNSPSTRRALIPTVSRSWAGFYLDQPDQRALLETWKSRPGMKGLRFYFSTPRSRSWPDDGTLDLLWPIAERLGLPVSLAAAAFLPKVERSPNAIRDCG